MEREYLFDNTYSLLNNEQREIFIECWLQNIKQDVYKIIKKTGSEICQNYLIVNACNELMRIGDILNDKL